MNLKSLIKEQLIFEGRIEDAKSFVVKDFQDLLIPQSYKEGERMPEWFQKLVDSDPSGNQKYLMWALKQIKKHSGKFHPFILTDVVLEKIIEGFVNFHKLQDKLNKENIDKVVSWKAVSNPTEFNINYGMDSPYFKFRYPIEELNKVLSNPKDINSYYDFYMLWEMVNAVKQLPTRADLKKEAVKLTDDNYWLVIVPMSHRASCSYGSNTRWCTTSREDIQYNKYQSNTSSLFYFIPKSNPLKSHQDYFVEYMDVEYDLSKIALHMNFEGDLIFYDASDGEIESYDVTNLVAEVYGLDSAQSFGASVLKAENYHKSKIEK
jgi:hypothetical protein